MKRNIRLKEFARNIEKVHTPTKEYMDKSPLLERGKSYFQRTNENGFIRTHLPFESDINVILIGDSFIENIFTDESKRISSIIEEMFLNEKKKIKIHNAGVSGSTGLGILNVILNKILFLKPDLIIYCQPSCDFSALLYENGYSNRSKFFSNLTPQEDNEKFKFDTIENNLYQISNITSIIAKTCQTFNIHLCMATCCSNSSKRQLKMMNDIIRDNSEKLGYDVIDLDMLVMRGDKYFYDKQHLNQDGAKYIARIFFEHLKLRFDYIDQSDFSFVESNIPINDNQSILNIPNKEIYLSSLILSIKNNDQDEKISVYLINKLKNKIKIKEVNIPIANELEISIPLDNFYGEYQLVIHSITNNLIIKNCRLISISK
ncbi:Uncharacterised protein [Actinobacillus lignieresii]|uniref:SGNH/GDSL hydrolase family protein n=1 Tax=Actinobacillus lignieresii TaxID=720 RepID=UPI000E1A6E84|nr:hypothetical protein [Actinobacillus lignieresii]SUT99863.1 Uncharacterised protein [Actinobacillus lignieresii]